METRTKYQTWNLLGSSRFDHQNMRLLVSKSSTSNPQFKLSKARLPPFERMARYGYPSVVTRKKEVRRERDKRFDERFSV